MDVELSCERPNTVTCVMCLCFQANVNGRVLSQCNIDELKKEMNMNFGDWQLFRATVSPRVTPHC